MSEAPFDIGTADFDAVYRNDGPIMGDVWFARPPWDIGAPQPVIVQCEQRAEFSGTVLDVGSGAGENAIFLAQCGYQVTGVDGSEAAVETARARATEQGASVEFVADDVTELAELEWRYDTVLDSALYHCLPSSEPRAAYAAALHRVTRPGARLHLFCFADEGPTVVPAPGPVSKNDLHANLGGHWNITDISLVWYQGALTVAEAKDSFTKIGGKGGGEMAQRMATMIESLPVDDNGWIQFPTWHLQANRID